MAQKQKKRPFLWVVIILLFVGLLGFGTGGFNGTIRSVGTVGEKEIPVTQYQNTLNEQLRALGAQLGAPIGFQQALQLGLDQSVLSQLVTQRTLDNEASNLGLSVGDARVREEVLRIPAFRGLDGTFNRDAYAETLRRVGQSEAQFETSLREDISRTLLQGAVVGGIPAPQGMASTIVNYQSEMRDITLATITADDLQEPVPGPTEDDIAAYYAENGTEFMQPEARDITYAWIVPSMIQDDLPIDEASLRTVYEERSAEFIQPERRLVERLAFVDQTAAEAARARFDAGDIDFDGLVEERGLNLADVDMGDVSEAGLNAAGADVFAAAPGDVVGPLLTPLGPALFRVNAVLAAEEITFEEALPDLRAERAAMQAVRAIEDIAESMNDLLAGGATLEDMAATTEMELGQIAYNDSVTDGIAAYDSFRAAAESATEGAFPVLLQLSDGGLFALRLNGVTPPQQSPLDDVRDAVAAAWVADRTQEMVMAFAEQKANEISPLTDLATLDLTAQDEDRLTRRSFVEGTPEGFAADVVFDMGITEVRVVDAGDAALIVRLDLISAPDLESEQSQAELQNVSDAATAGIAQDIFDAFSATVQNRTDVEINQAAINAVHATLQ